MRPSRLNSELNLQNGIEEQTMTHGYRILSVIIAGAFVAGSGLADSAVAKTKKKLTYEQAWEVCKKEMDKMGIFGTSTQAVERHTRGAGCMKRYGYKI
jgi:hypothetical protein